MEIWIKWINYKIFLTAPTVEGLNGLTKEQLCKVAEHFNFEVAVKKKKL